MIRRMDERPDIVVAEPLSMDQERGVEIEEVETVEADIGFRRDALDAIGGFDRSFSTVAALDESCVNSVGKGTAVRMLGVGRGTVVVGGERNDSLPTVNAGH